MTATRLLKSWCVRVAAVTTCLTIETSHGHGVVPRDAPVDRLIANLQAYIKEHPNEALGYYRLGRVHVLALESQSEFVPVFDHAKIVEPAEGSWAQKSHGDRMPAGQQSSRDQQLKHLSEAIRLLNRAIELNPTAAKFRLTLACALEAGESMKEDVRSWPLMTGRTTLEFFRSSEPSISADWRQRIQSLPEHPENLDRLIQSLRESSYRQSERDIAMAIAYEYREKPMYADLIESLRHKMWRDLMEEQYFTAMCYALPDNGRASEKPIWGGMENWVAFEAAADYVRVLGNRQPRPMDQISLKVAKATLAAFNDLPVPNAITPIVASMDSKPLRELVSDSSTNFDLEGSGRPQAWTWVCGDAGILIWDPGLSGKVTSGQQLFGSATWNVRFENGYQALDALDDDRDGELKGNELRGIAVWFDRNGNGVCESGESASLESLGIVGVATRADPLHLECLGNPSGVRLSSGEFRPTYDWVAESRPVSRGVKTVRQTAGEGNR